MLSSVRLSVCLSVRPSVTRVDQSKTLEARIMQLSPPGSPMTLVFSRLTSPRNSKGNTGSQGAKYRSYFRSYKHCYFRLSVVNDVTVSLSSL